MNETWDDRFRKAISEDDALGRSLLGITDDRLEPAAEGFGARVALPELARLWLVRRAEDLASACICESPIEEAMYWALLIEATKDVDAVIVRFGTRTVGVEEMVPETVWIEPQAALGSYRVDFLLTFRDRWGFEEHSDARVIVECDGHDYHERTKEQARKDKARDRALQALGMRVLRFTGSEIWRNPLACAHEAISQAAEAAHAEGRRNRGVPE